MPIEKEEAVWFPEPMWMFSRCLEEKTPFPMPGIEQTFLTFPVHSISHHTNWVVVWQCENKLCC